MKKLFSRVVRFIRAEDGPTAIEYTLMLALIIVICLVAIGAFGYQSNASFSTTGSKLKAAAS